MTRGAVTTGPPPSPGGAGAADRLLDYGKEDKCASCECRIHRRRSDPEFCDGCVKAIEEIAGEMGIDFVGASVRMNVRRWTWGANGVQAGTGARSSPRAHEARFHGAHRDDT